jgi:hypothetical protein
MRRRASRGWVVIFALSVEESACPDKENIIPARAKSKAVRLYKKRALG